MADETTSEPVAEITATRTYCPICWSTMYYTEWEGMMGWRCPDPDCDFFIPDPL